MRPSTRKAIIRKPLTRLFASKFFFSPLSTPTYSLAFAIWKVIRKPNNRISNRKRVDMIVKQVLSMVDNTFFQERIVFCQQRNLAQYLSGLPHDQSYKAQRDAEVEEVEGHVVGGDVLGR